MTVIDQIGSAESAQFITVVGTPGSGKTTTALIAALHYADWVSVSDTFQVEITNVSRRPMSRVERLEQFRARMRNMAAVVDRERPGGPVDRVQTDEEVAEQAGIAAALRARQMRSIKP